MLKPFTPDYADYLRDESRQSGSADTIAFPLSTDDVVTIVNQTARSNTPCTIQGGRTGITAGAVPQGGCIINLSRMRRITAMRYDGKQFLITVEPGLVLSELKTQVSTKKIDTTNWSAESIRAHDLFVNAPEQLFTPDPTETSATIGGMVACNASGARTFMYGPTRAHVSLLKVVLADGSVLVVDRNRQSAVKRNFSLTAENQKTYSGKLPAYAMPYVKNAAGYFVKDNMDLIDLFIGAEGTLGIITEIELCLVEKPASIKAITVFFQSENQSIGYVEAIRNSVRQNPPAHASIAAIEFFDQGSLNLLRAAKLDGGIFTQPPDLPPSYHSAVYTEFHGTDHDVIDTVLMKCMESVTAHGGSDDSVWLAETPQELKRLTFFRHAVPELVNKTIDERRKSNPSITKLGTDMAVPDIYLKEVFSLYRSGLAESKLEAVLFGHIGNNHIHVNILPRNEGEYVAGKQLYSAWARQIVRWGGTISAEHGVGKLKNALLKEMYGDDGIQQMRELKKIFDPHNRLNPGNLF